MKNSKEYGVKFASHIKKLKKSCDPPEMDGPLEVLVYSQLLWESSSAQADKAWDGLKAVMGDWHELRVSTPPEIAEACYDTSELAFERAKRLKLMLNHLYQRHHEVTMTPEFEHGKRDLRESIESLDGMTPFVASRWLLLCGDIGDVPVDNQLCWMLANAGCIDESASVADAAVWVCRQVKSEHALVVHNALQAWANGQSEAELKKRSKAEFSARSAATRARTKSIANRHLAQQVAKKKKAEAAARAAAKKAAAEQAAIDAEQRAIERETNSATKKTSSKKNVAKKSVPKKELSKKTPSKKKVTKKNVAKKKVTKKNATKKNVAKKKVTKKNVAKKKVTKKNVAKKKVTKKNVAKKTTKKKVTKKQVAKKKTRSTKRKR